MNNITFLKIIFASCNVLLELKKLGRLKNDLSKMKKGLFFQIVIQTLFAS